ncbi:MAG: beta strand repeat-containing protein, partial [Gaiellaceae bacterium]
LGYGVYRSTSSGAETLLEFVTGTTDTDTGSKTPTTAKASDVTDKKSGVGVAVAVNVVIQTTTAYIGNQLIIDAASTTVETTAPGASTSSAHATSGAGGSKVGVAGSIAVNVVNATATGDVETTGPVTLNHGDLTLTSAGNLSSSAIADAVQKSGNTIGIGASFALDVVNDTVDAGIPANAVLNGAKNLTITSTDTDSATTEADGGAGAGTGSFALSAEVAITISNVTTTASVGSGSGLTLTGGLTAHATQTASTKTIAKGATSGGTAGIGLSLALLSGDHEVYSQLLRNLTAGGDVSFAADGSSSNDTEATASAVGAPGKSDTSTSCGASGDGKDTCDSSGKDVNKKADDNLSTASASDKSGKTASKKTPDASSGENGGTKVTVAAAASIALVTAVAEASLEKDVTTTGSVSLASSEDTDSTAKANGSASKASTANIGAAVAINLVSITNEAIVDTNVLVSSFGLTVAAAMRTSGGSDGKNTLDTESTAGAGDGKVGIAGSLALTIATINTTAEIKSNSSRGPPGDNLNGKDLSLSAAASVSSTTKAMAKDTNAGTVGIGAGAAINIVGDTTTASIDDGATFSTATGNTPGNVSLTATDTDSATTYAEAGATGASGSTLSLSADAAIALPTVITSATIGGTGQELDASGKVTLTATQTASATTTAKGNAAGGTAAIGLALALAVPDDEVTATVSRTLGNSTAKVGAVSLTASGSATIVTEADASAAGANGKDSNTKSTDASGKDVNGKADDQLASANKDATSNGGKASKTTDTKNAKATTSDSNGNGGNTVTVAGAAAINVATTLSKAYFADSAVITSSAQVTLKALANTDASATGNGSATQAGSVGIGAGVAVNSANITNIATTGNSTITSNGIDIEATMRANGTDHLQRFDGTNWTTIDSGATFPESPSDGDFFQITNAVPATTTVDGGQQIDSTHTSLQVKSTTDFGPQGTFTITGVSGTCTYTGKDSTHLTGVGGCTVAAADKATIDKVTVTETSTTTVNSATTQTSGAQTLGNGNLTVGDTTGFYNGAGTFTVTGVSGTCSYTGTDGTHLESVTGCTGSVASGTVVTAGQNVTQGLAVASTDDFSTTGIFTVTGVTGTCAYTGKDSTHLTGITGCTGTPANGATVTPDAKAPGVYEWVAASSSWQLQTAGIPSGTSFPTSPATNDYFQATKAAAAAVNGAQTLSSGSNLTVASTAGFNSTGTITIGSATCSYSSTDATHFNNLSGAGCTGSAADKASVSGGLAAGIYKWNGSA